MTTEKPCNPHPDAPHGFVRNASHSVGHYVCECSGWTPPASIQEELRSVPERSRTTLEAADRIDALEAEIQILTAEREVYAATADRAIAQVEALTKDAERLDHIQVTGSTVEIVNFGQKPVQHSFRVGGLYKAINFDLRLAIDAAIAAQKEQT